MEKNIKSPEFLSKMALISEATEDLIRGKVTVVYQLDRETYDSVHRSFNQNIEDKSKEFKIEISNTDFIFVSGE